MTLRERIEKLAEMYEAEIAEDRRVAALPDTWPDTRSTITCLAIRTERCAADLRALLAADEGGDAPDLATLLRESDALAEESESDFEENGPDGWRFMPALRDFTRRVFAAGQRTAPAHPASAPVVGDCGVATRRKANPASASEPSCPSCKEMREALAVSGGILESLAAAVRWELAPEIMEEIRAVLPRVRRALSGGHR